MDAARAAFRNAVQRRIFSRCGLPLSGARPHARGDRTVYPRQRPRLRTSTSAWRGAPALSRARRDLGPPHRRRRNARLCDQARCVGGAAGAGHHPLRAARGTHRQSLSAPAIDATLAPGRAGRRTALRRGGARRPALSLSVPAPGGRQHRLFLGRGGRHAAALAEGRPGGAPRVSPRGGGKRLGAPGESRRAARRLVRGPACARYRLARRHPWAAGDPQCRHGELPAGDRRNHPPRRLCGAHGRCRRAATAAACAGDRLLPQQHALGLDGYFSF